MGAPCPTTRSTHAFTHFIQADYDTVFSGLIFLGRGHPADPLIACQWGDICPDSLHRGVGVNGFLKIGW